MNSGLRLVWTGFGCVFLALGAIGVVLPLIPTTPFLLLAVFCFARSSPRLHDWILEHRTFGPLVHNWREHGSIDRRSKQISIVVIALTVLVSVLLDVPHWALAAQIVVLAMVATFILTRPETTD